jgi:uroporphyrinogen-III synthase
VLLTRDGGLAEAVRALGAEVRVVPVLAFERVPHDADPAAFDWIVFTSARAVAYFGPFRAAPVRVACVGPETARAVEAHGIRVDFVPERGGGAGLLAEEMARRFPLAGARVLFPCADRAGPALPDGLARAGARVTRLVVYRTCAGAAPVPETSGADVVVFLSPSSVEAYESLGGDLSAAPALAIGPATERAFAERGFRAVTAPSADRAGILKALSDWEFPT